MPSNYVKKGKKSIFDKILPRKLPFSLTSTSCTSATSSTVNACVNNANRPLLNTQKSSDSTSSPTQHKNVIKYNANESFNTTTTSSTNTTETTTTGFQMMLNTGCRAVVKHKYTASKPDEITLNVGVKVSVVQKFGDGWWRVCVVGNESESGLYPSNYLLEEPVDTSLNSSFSSQKSPVTAYNITSPFSQSSITNSSHINNTSSLTYASSQQKHESLSSAERDVEYVRVMYAFDAASESLPDRLSVRVNDVLKLIDDDQDQQDQQQDLDRSWLKVMNSQGVVGYIPSKCVQPIILNDEQQKEFVFIRRPTCVGLFAHMPWYYGNVSRLETNALLNKYAVNGDYLVRDSEREVLNLLFFLLSFHI